MSNLVADQKVNWNSNETVRPVDMNKIGEGINKVTSLMPTYACNGSFYENTSFSSNTYLVKPVTFTDSSQNAAPPAYVNGMEVVFKAILANTGDTFVNVNNLGAKQIKTLKNVVLTTGSIPEGWIISLRYDSTQDCFYLLENRGTVGRNVGDIFTTERTDNNLNGAYETNGQEFNFNDFIGDTNPYDLLVSNSLPSLSYEQYAQQISSQGSCGYFALDTVNKKFKLPKFKTISRILVDKKEATPTDKTWYNLYSDGWIEQGGVYKNTNTSGRVLYATIPLIINMIDSQYSLSCVYENISSPKSETSFSTDSLLTNSFSVSIWDRVTSNLPTGNINWSIRGYTQIPDKSSWTCSEAKLTRYMVQLATGATDEALVTCNNLSAEVAKKSNIIWYANRDFEYKTPNFIKADKQNVTIKAGTAIRLANGSTFFTENDYLKTISEILDTGSVENGKDYYFYLNNQGELKASLNENLPVGEIQAVKIGGAHTLCVAVTESNAPVLPNDSFWMNHPAIGYNAGYFIPNSSWTPAFKSGAKTGNKGQVFIDHHKKFWVDIYLQSGTGSATGSTYSGTITNNRQPIMHHWDMTCIGKELPDDMEFTVFAEGSNQRTAIAGAAIPANRLTGGYLDSAGKRMISGWFVEACCGYLWQWSRELAATGTTGWSSYADNRRGDSYGMPYVLLFGGAYDNSSNCGSLARSSADNRVSVSVSFGARGVSLHQERVHA